MLASCAAACLGQSLEQERRAKMGFLFFTLGYWAGRLLSAAAWRHFRRTTAEEGGSQMITLKLTATPVVERKTLCTACRFSHVVRGYEKGQELIACGYAFPPREILFAVQECTDFRAEREAAMALSEAVETCNASR
jgi:hypothetical protein